MRRCALERGRSHALETLLANQRAIREDHTIALRGRPPSRGAGGTACNLLLSVPERTFGRRRRGIRAGVLLRRRQESNLGIAVRCSEDCWVSGPPIWR
jgi:hypothetical protein